MPRFLRQAPLMLLLLLPMAARGQTAYPSPTEVREAFLELLDRARFPSIPRSWKPSRSAMTSLKKR